MVGHKEDIRGGRGTERKEERDSCGLCPRVLHQVPSS